MPAKWQQEEQARVACIENNSSLTVPMQSHSNVCCMLSRKLCDFVIVFKRFCPFMHSDMSVVKHKRSGDVAISGKKCQAIMMETKVDTIKRGECSEKMADVACLC